MLYDSPKEALGDVKESYLYWTGKLTETSFQLSFALLAANWAIFGSVDGILKNFWSKLSVALVIAGLGLSVAGAKWIGELARARIEYAESNTSRWKEEFDKPRGQGDPWPFTDRIQGLGRSLREVKLWLPLAAGVSFFVAILSR